MNLYVMAKKEMKVLVRLHDEDIEIFESVREHVKCYIDAELFRIVLRKFHESMRQDTSQYAHEQDRESPSP